MTKEIQLSALKNLPPAPAPVAPPAPAPAGGTAVTFDVRQLNVWFGGNHVLRNVSLEISTGPGHVLISFTGDEDTTKNVCDDFLKVTGVAAVQKYEVAV